MDYRLLLVDGQGEAKGAPLRLRTLREFPGLTGLSAHFRPVRNESASWTQTERSSEYCVSACTLLRLLSSLGVCCWNSRMFLTPNRILKRQTAHGR